MLEYTMHSFIIDTHTKDDNYTHTRIRSYKTSKHILAIATALYSPQAEYLT